MWLNILIIAVIGLGTYGLTIYFDRQTPPPAVIKVPVETNIELDKTADIMPAFTFTTIKGKTFSTDDLKGKIIVLNFWASWCVPCVKEFPDLLTLAANHKDDVILIALSSDIEEETMLRFLDKMKRNAIPLDAPNVLIALDEKTRITRGLFQTYRLPETIIIDRNGKMRRKLVGANWDTASVESFVSKL